MIEWLKRFYTQNHNITLTLKGKTFKKTDCERIGGVPKNMSIRLKAQTYAFLFQTRVGLIGMRKFKRKNSCLIKSQTWD